MNKKIIFIILAFLLVLAGFFYFYFLNLKKYQVPQVKIVPHQQPMSTSTIQEKKEETVVINNDFANQQPLEITQEDLENIAKFFAQKFGSFSNQANYENLNDLMPLVAEDFKNQLLNSKGSQSGADYYTVESKVLSVKTIDFIKESGSASVLVTVLRKDMEGDAKKQDLKIEFIKTGDLWQVKNALWQ